jgi:glycosyltransferase involved in cell wall biosynthesis
MFVVMIIQAYEPYPFIGGAERQLTNLARRMDAKGIKVHILTRRYPGLKAFERIDGIPVHRLPAKGPKVIASLLFTASALPILWRLKPDIIHAHELLSPTTTAVVAKRLFGVPVVAKVLAGGPIGDIARMGNRFGGPARLEMFRRDVDVFISVSSEIDDELEAWGILASRRARIPNGVDTRTFHPVTPDTQREIRNKLDLPKSPLVVYAGRLAPEKQIDRLLAVWPAVRASVTEATLLILGAGPEENNLRRQAGEGVAFLGRVDDVASYFQAADLFVLPSRREGLSNAMLEAMASGLPVVSSDATGARDAIRDRVNGRLVPQNDLVELKQTIVELLLDEEQCARLGREARATVESSFSIESTCQQLCDLYGSVIQQTDLAPEQALRSES